MVAFVTRQRGLALPVTIAMMVVVMVLGVALWSYASAETIQVARTEKQMQAHFLARSGVEIIAAYFSEPANASNIEQYLGRTSEPVELGQGSFRMHLSAQLDDRDDSSVVVVESTGRVGGVISRVEAVMRESPLWEDIAIAADHLGVDGQAHEVRGNVLYRTLEGSLVIVGEAKDEFDPDVFTSIDDFPGKDDLIPLNGDTELSWEALVGNKYIGYYDEEITLRGGTHLTVDLGDGEDNEVILLTERFDAKGGSGITLTGKGQLVWYITEEFDAGGGFSVEASDGASIFVVMKDGSSFELHGGSGFDGVVYGPGADISIRGLGAGGPPGAPGAFTLVRGTVVGKTVNISGRATIEYKEIKIPHELDEFTRYRIVRWRISQ